jgi:soluble lytic murein transglycosylase-like protein
MTLIVVASGASAQGAYDALIAKHAAAHGVPESLVRRVIRIESRGNSQIVSKGNYGLMQIRLGTARLMGYSGTAEGLLDPDTNMTYAVKYLAGAYRAAGGDHDRAIANYQRGYRLETAKAGISRGAPTVSLAGLPAARRSDVQVTPPPQQPAAAQPPAQPVQAGKPTRVSKTAGAPLNLLSYLKNLINSTKTPSRRSTHSVNEARR